MRFSLPSTVLAATYLCCSAACSAQVVAPAMGDLLKPSGRIDRNIFKAGDTVRVVVQLGQSAPRKMTITAFANCINADRLYSQASVNQGENVATFLFPIPSNAASAACTVAVIEIQPPSIRPGDQAIVLPTSSSLSSPVKFEFIGPPRIRETLPGQPSASVELSEAQYFRSRAFPLRETREQLLSFLDQHSNANETRSVDEFLINILGAAQKDLHGTLRELEVRYKPKNGPPTLFEDLDRRYSALILDITDHRNHLAVGTYNRARLVQVNAQQSSGVLPKTQENITVLAGTLPPDASESLNVLDWNIAVYERIADTGMQTFSLSLVSSPPDAVVEAKRIGEEYLALGSKTTISKVTFDFAVWTFRFTKAGCQPFVQRYDPVRDTSPAISVDLVCGR